MELYLHPIFYGPNTPDLRFESRGGTPVYFCRNNRTIHLTEHDYDDSGTLQAGRCLHTLCKEFCRPTRGSDHAPCPAFVESHDVSPDVLERDCLSTVSARSPVRLDLCLGVQKLLELTQTPEERFFLETYLAEHVVHEAEWRNELVDEWNTYWEAVDDDWLGVSRRDKFDRLMWATVRYPALIPQFWVNWLAWTDRAKVLDENPSRVDFVAFHEGRRHIIEIDGPSHYADFDELTSTYMVDERAYARNLKIARSLEREGWRLTRVGRIEVRDAMPQDSEASDFAAAVRGWQLVRLLSFPDRQAYPEQPGWDAVGLPEIERAVADEIPF